MVFSPILRPARSRTEKTGRGGDDQQVPPSASRRRVGGARLVVGGFAASPQNPGVRARGVGHLRAEGDLCVQIRKRK